VLTVQTVQEYVDFVVNAPYPRVLELLGEASIGLNTMVDEHFGINVVEFMVSTIFPNIVHPQQVYEWLMELLCPSI
jgi:alpha-1,2-mannosyltransferase